MKKQAGSLKEWVIWTLRKASYRWPPRNAAFRAASISKAEYLRNPGESVTKRVRNFFRCAICKKGFSRKGVSADHREPVINPKRGFEGFDVYIPRLLCEERGFQIICHTDHDKKTHKETKLRVKYRRARR